MYLYFHLMLFKKIDRFECYDTVLASLCVQLMELRNVTFKVTLFLSSHIVDKGRF